MDTPEARSHVFRGRWRTCMRLEPQLFGISMASKAKIDCDRQSAKRITSRTDQNQISITIKVHSAAIMMMFSTRFSTKAIIVLVALVALLVFVSVSAVDPYY